MGNSAQMVNGVTLDKGPNVHLVRYSMRPLFHPVVSGSSNVEEAVAVGVHSPGPLPTTGLLIDGELGVEANFVRRVSAVACHTTEYTELGEQFLAMREVEV